MQLTGWPLVVGGNDRPELQLPGEQPTHMTRRLALQKTEGLAGLVLGSDTVVADDGRILGKPGSTAEARATLLELRGRSHQVVTSIALVDREQAIQRLDTCVSRIPMRDYSEPELERYLAGGSPMDKAGSYGIQDREFQPVDMRSLTDCYANVMGLPLCHVVRNMRALGHEPPNDVPQACCAHTGYDCQVYPAILRGER